MARLIVEGSVNSLQIIQQRFRSLGVTFTREGEEWEEAETEATSNAKPGSPPADPPVQMMGVGDPPPDPPVEEERNERQAVKAPPMTLSTGKAKAPVPAKKKQ